MNLDQNLGPNSKEFENSDSGVVKKWVGDFMALFGHVKVKTLDFSESGKDYAETDKKVFEFLKLVYPLGSNEKIFYSVIAHLQNLKIKGAVIKMVERAVKWVEEFYVVKFDKVDTKNLDFLFQPAEKTFKKFEKIPIKLYVSYALILFILFYSKKKQLQLLNKK